MKKKLIAFTTLFAIAAQPLAYCDEGAPPADPEPEFYFDDEDNFPEGKLVGEASNEGIRVARRARMRNWSLAVAVVAIGVATLILVKKKS